MSFAMVTKISVPPFIATDATLKPAATVGALAVLQLMMPHAFTRLVGASAFVIPVVLDGDVTPEKPR
jgi:hypothetical protein